MTDKNRPVIFRHKSGLPPDAKLVDALRQGIEELFFIQHPHLKRGMLQAEPLLRQYRQDYGISGAWIFFPWNNTAVQTLPEADFFTVRTARNKEVITIAEQERFRRLTVGVAGLSVGSSVLWALTLSGGPKVIKIADFDAIELSNLNRLRASIIDLGANKAWVAARQVWELDPYADLRVWDEGLNKDTIEDFLVGEPKLEAFVDQMDSLDMKAQGRVIAREHGIPVLMATDNGDSVILDVERFDLEPKRALFHGLVEDINEASASRLDYQHWLEMATGIVGPEFLTENMQKSLLAIGRSIASVPQLGATAGVAGAAMAFALRRIAAGQDMPSGRYQISLEEKLVPHYRDPENVAARKAKTREFIASFAAQASSPKNP